MHVNTLLGVRGKVPAALRGWTRFMWRCEEAAWLQRGGLQERKSSVCSILQAKSKVPVNSPA